MLEPQPHRGRVPGAAGAPKKEIFLFCSSALTGSRQKKGGRRGGLRPPLRPPFFCLLPVRGDEQNKKLSFSGPPPRLLYGNSVVETLEGSRVAELSSASEPAQCAEDPMCAGASQANRCCRFGELSVRRAVGSESCP